jgi:hypothetical protein
MMKITIEKQERNFKFEANMAAMLFGKLMKGRIKDAPVRDYCPKEVAALFERTIQKAFLDGYFTHASEMESLFFQLRCQDDGIKHETNRDTYEWVQEQIKKS